MTSVSTSIPIRDSAGETPVPVALSATRKDWIIWAWTVAGIGVLFGLLVNPYWVPGGDSEVYLSVARSLVKTGHFAFNGLPVSMIPPGWPIVLALALKVSPTFLCLKLITMFSMLGSQAMAFWVVRRFVSAPVASATILLTTILSHVYSLTFWLHSDAFFCLTTVGSLLLAIQIGERKSWHWRLPLFLLLCIVSVAVRWAAAPGWIVIAAFLVNGDIRPRLDARWIAVVLSFIVTAGTFFATRALLNIAYTPEQLSEMKSYGGAGETSPDTGVPAAPNQPDVAGEISKQYKIFNRGGPLEYLIRVVSWGNWFSFLYWQPLRLAMISNMLNVLSILMGWITAAPLLYLAVTGLRRKEWVWPALTLYCFALCLNWTHPNARYYVPVSFLLLTSIWVGVTRIKEWLLANPKSSLLIKGLTVTVGLFVATVALCNASLYAVEVRVHRSGEHFYDRYEGGLDGGLIAAGVWLSEQPGLDYKEIAVSSRYENYGKVRNSRLGLRAIAMLTGKIIVSVPVDAAVEPSNSKFKNFWREGSHRKIKYYLYQPPVSPWRVMHFRVPWLQEWKTKKPVEGDTAGWQLYEIDRAASGAATLIHLPPIDIRATRVPGF